MVVASRSEENQYISLPLTKYFDGSNDQRKIATVIRSPRRVTPSPRNRLVMENSRKELFRTIGSLLNVAEEFVFRSVFENPALVHEDHAVCNLLCESHLVC